MLSTPAIVNELSSVPGLMIAENVPLSRYTRFGIGGPARVFAETADERSFVQAIRTVEASGSAYVVIGGGTNLVVSDAGYDGVVLRFTGQRIQSSGNVVTAEAGATLQDLVDFTVERGLAGIHTMTGVPGSVGAAVYGNAGAYGRSVAQSLASVRFFDGVDVRTFNNAACQFEYRGSTFKRHKRWIILSADFALEPADAAELQRKSDEILGIRNRKYPPEMKCAGSIFKNLLFAQLPESVRVQVPERVIIEGKVPAAYFLEQVGAKGMTNGDIHVADYHANLIYNAGHGTAEQVAGTIRELKDRIRERFGFDIEEEVQYVGFKAA